MSNSDQSVCQTCFTKNSYAKLSETATNHCGPKCMDRFNTERSVKDQMYYDHFVLNKPWNFEIKQNKNVSWEKCQK